LWLWTYSVFPERTLFDGQACLTVCTRTYPFENSAVLPHTATIWSGPHWHNVLAEVYFYVPLSTFISGEDIFDGQNLLDGNIIFQIHCTVRAALPSFTQK